MRSLYFMVGIGVIVVVIMYFTTTNMNTTKSTTPTTNTPSVNMTDSTEVTDSGESQPDTDASETESSNPSAGELSDKYMAYITALEDGTPADTVLAMFTSKWRDYLVQKVGGKPQALNSLRLMDLAKDYQIVKVDMITRTNTILKQDGVYAILYLKGRLAAVNREVTSMIIFYQEDGIWKLSGEDNSLMDEMYGGNKSE